MPGQEFSTSKPDDDLTRIALENEIISEFPMDDRLRNLYSVYHTELGRKYETRNMLEKAAYEYRRALVIYPYSTEARLLYAEILKRMGYLERYLMTLNAIVAEGVQTTDILDEIEIRKSMINLTLSEKWSIDQFTAAKDSYRLALFFAADEINHHEAESIISEYMEYLLMAYENISISFNGVSDDFSYCFRKARESDSDYFVLFTLNEMERLVSIDSDIYLADTGNLLSSLKSVRTGNQMLPEAGRNAADLLHGLFPVKGRILNRKFDEVLVNLGKKDGISVGDVFSIIKKGKLIISKDSFGYTFNNEDLLGEYTVNNADELVSDGVISVNGFYDMINPGDIILVREEPADEQPQENTADEQMFTEGELFKSITNIQ